MHWLRSRIQSWLDLEAGELTPALLCFAISFTWGFSQMLSWTAANTLFLQFYDASELPFVSIATAVLLPLTGLLFMRLNRRLSYPAQFRIFALLFVLAPLAFRGLLESGGGPMASLAFSIWYYMEVAFAALLMDSLVNRMFNLRQVRRVFGPISTGSDLAGVPAGLLVGVIVARTGVENLLLFSAGVSSIVLLFFLLVKRRYGARMQIAVEPEEHGDEEVTSRGSILSLLRHPLVLGILAMEALFEFNLEFINNAFYSQTEAYLSDPEQMAAFLGRFFAVASVFSAVLQMLASSRLMRWFGVGGCLVIGPILVGAALIGFLVSDYLALAPMFVFACMASAKFMQYTVLVNINDVAQFTLIRSLPQHLQDRVLATSGTVLAPILGGLSGLALLGMIHLFNATASGISMVVLGMLAVIIAIALRSARAYRRNLRELLASRAVGGIELPLNDPETARTLLTLCANPDPKTALCSLELLSKRMHPGLAPALAQAMQHPDVGVRREAALVCLRMGGPPELPILTERLQKESDPDVVSKLLPAVARHGGAQSFDILLQHLGHTDQRVKQGACIGLIRHYPGEGRKRAGDILTKLAVSPDASERLFAAETLGEVRVSDFDPLIIPLLGDSDVDVRAAAIESAGRLRHPGIGPALLQSIDDTRLRPLVVRSLAFGSDAILPSIDALLDDPGQDDATRRTILELYGRIRTDSCVVLLRKRLPGLPPVLQAEAIKSLAQCRYLAVEDDRELLESLMRRYCASAAWLLACRSEVGALAGNELLARALDYELHKVKKLLFHLLSFLYPLENIEHIRAAYFTSHSEEKISAAVELLDTMLESRHRDMLIPILEEASAERRRAMLDKYFPLDSGGTVMRLVEVMNGRYSAPNPWLQAVTLDFVSRTDSLAGVAGIGREDSTVLDTTREWLKRTGPGPGKAGLSVVDKVAALKRARIFADVPDEILAEYAPATTARRFAAGARIMNQGETGDTLSIIVSGRLRVARGDKMLAEMTAGDVVGELAALNPEPRSADVDAVEDTVLLDMAGKTVERMMAGRGEAARGIMRELCGRIQSMISERIYEDTGSFAVVHASRVQPQPVSPASLAEVEKAVLLKTVEVFSSVPDAVLMHLASLAREQWLESGGVIFRRGEAGTSMFVIVDGEVAVHDDDRLIATLGRGKIIGEMALLTSEPRSTSITAMTPTRLLRISQYAMDELMWDHAQMSRSLIRVLVARLRAMISGPAQGTA